MKNLIVFILLYTVSLTAYGQSVSSEEKTILFEQITFDSSLKENSNTLAALELNKKGVERSLKGHHSEAVSLLKQAQSLLPELPAIQFNLGKSLMKQKSYSEALEVFEKLTQLHPNYANGFHGKGEALFNLKRFEESIAAYEQELKLSPLDPIALNNLGDALFQIGKYEIALIPLSKAIEVSKNFVHAYNNRASSLIMLGRYSEALADLNKVISIDKSIAETYNNLGVLFYNQNEFKKAHKSFSEAVRLKPDWDLALYNLANNCLRTGKDEKVREYQNLLSRMNSKFAVELNEQFLSKYILKTAQK